MKRAKIGDVFCIDVPNGCKIFQWAYTIPKKGDYIRVFDGLYHTLPNNLEEIVSKPHSYIISFAVAKAHRIGLARFLGNFDVPEKYPFPKYQLRFDIDPYEKKVDAIHVMNSDGTRDVWKWYNVSAVSELPEEYREVSLINAYLTPNWVLYLFDGEFNLRNPERFHIGLNPEETLQKYTDIVNNALRKKEDGSIAPLENPSYSHPTNPK